jgi:hypothetical protein
MGDGLELRGVQSLQEGPVPVWPLVAASLGSRRTLGSTRVRGPGRIFGCRRQCPIPTCWERWSDLPSVSSAGATITSAFWNSFTLP